GVGRQLHRRVLSGGPVSGTASVYPGAGGGRDGSGFGAGGDDGQGGRPGGVVRHSGNVCGAGRGAGSAGGAGSRWRVVRAGGGGAAAGDDGALPGVLSVSDPCG